MTFGLGLTIFILISIYGLGLLVYFKNPKNKTNRLFAVMVFWIIVWMASNFLENETSDLKLATLFLRIDFASASLLVYFWFLFCLNFPQPYRALSKIKNILIFIPAIVFAGLSFSDLIIRNIRFDTDGILFDLGNLYPFYSIYIVSYMIIGACGALILKYRKTQGLQRTQILYVFLGLSLSALIAVVINLFFQQMLSVELFRIGIYGAIFLVGFTAYAIVKKRLFGIKVVLTTLLIVAIAFLLSLDALVFTERLSFQIVKGGILAVFLYFGYLLVKSVMREIYYREQARKAYEIEKEARKKIQELGEAKTQFIMATQHHLRTPLTSMKGYIDLILTGSYGKVFPKVKQAILKLEASTSRLIRIVNELLDISQFQLGKKVVSLQSNIKIEPILKEVLEELQFTAKTKGIYLKLEKPKEKIPDIKADSEKLKVALFNIIDNGIKYTNKGGITIKLQLRDGKLQIISKDTGMGISKEDMKTLFVGIFERGKEAKKVFTTGRGIGLYIVSKIIQAHNGKVWAESEGKGKGSTFYVELPTER